MKILGEDGVAGIPGCWKDRLLHEEVLRRGSDGYLRNKSDAPWPGVPSAEICLNKAEAAMEISKTGDAATALNMVRESGHPDAFCREVSWIVSVMSAA